MAAEAKATYNSAETTTATAGTTETTTATAGTTETTTATAGLDWIHGHVVNWIRATFIFSL